MKCPFCDSENLRAVIYNPPGEDTCVFDSCDTEPQYFEGPILAVMCEKGPDHIFWVKIENTEGMPRVPFGDIKAPKWGIMCVRSQYHSAGPGESWMCKGQGRPGSPQPNPRPLEFESEAEAKKYVGILKQRWYDLSTQLEVRKLDNEVQ